MSRAIEKARDVIEKADAVLITAGAGMGVDSGLPDFRGDEGFWRAYPVIAKLGHSFSAMANPEWFNSNPKLAWAFYGHRLNLYRETVPHEGFNILKELVASKKDYFIFTSNVDGQFQKAGFPEEKIYECHGSIHYLQCTTKCSQSIYSAKDEEVTVDMEKFEAMNIPKCINCGAVARPNILMFGDWGWDGSRSEAQNREYDDFLASVYFNHYKLVVIEIGAGTHIPTIREESEYIAQEMSSFVVRINPRDYDIDEKLGVGITLGGLAGLKRLIKN
jgi:NAD-dependent SIR2 family protein deacetylase